MRSKILNYLNNQNKKVRRKLRKHRKAWIVVPLVTLSIVGGATATSAIVSARSANPLELYSTFLKHKPKLAHFAILHSRGQVVSGNYAGQKGIHKDSVYESFELHNHSFQFPLKRNHKPIIVKWTNAIDYNGQKLNAYLRLNPNSYKGYDPAYRPDRKFWQRNPCVNVGKDFYDGLTYQGITRMDAKFWFTDSHDNIKSIPNSLMAFDSLNGERWSGRPGDNAPYLDGHSGRSKGNMGDTGEFTNYETDLDDPGIITSRPPRDLDKSNIASYFSSLFHSKVNGGLYNHGFFDTNRGFRAAESGKNPSFFKNSILYLAKNSPYQDFRFGSGIGGAWWKLSAHDFNTSTKLQKQTEQGSHKDSGYHKYMQTNPGHFSYTINGQVPSSGNHYWLYDPVPKDAHDPKATVNGIPSNLLTQKGRYIHLDLNKSQINKLSNKKFTIKVNAKADNTKTTKKFTNGVRVREDNHKPIDRYASNIIKGHKSKPKPKGPQTPTPITKTTNQQNLTHPGESYSYTITGKIPKWKYHNTAHWTRDWYPGSPGFEWGGHYYPGTPGHYGPRYIDYYYNAYPNDHYIMTDDLPSYVSIKGIDSDGMPVVHNGNHVAMKLNPSNMEAYSGRNYKITIHVKADKLPGLTGNNDHGTDGSSISGPNKWLNWYNQAHADEQLYTKDHDYRHYNEHSHKVRNRIRRIKYHVYHYDYDHDQNGKGKGYNIPKKEMPGHDDHSLDHNINKVDLGDYDDGGDNDQFKGHFKRNDILKQYTKVGYEGSHVPISILRNRHNNYTDENGKTQHGLYKFGYDEHAKTVYPVLGGFDNTSHSSKESGHILPMSSRPDADESRSFHKSGDNDNGSADPNAKNYGNDTDASFTMDFYKPYIVPRAKTTKLGRFIVDTDKKNAGDKGLPFRLDIQTLDYVHNFPDDFKGDLIHVHITDPKSGTTLYDNEVPMSDTRIFSPHHQGKKHKGTRLVEFKDRLNTKTLNLPKGAKVPLHVDVGYVDPSQAQLDGEATDSHAWIASQHNMIGSGRDHHSEDHDDKAFDNGQKSVFTEPERTIKYFTQPKTNKPRTQFERMEIDQDHTQPATLKTGYGIRNDMRMKYTGLIGDDSHGTQWADGDASTGSGYRKQAHNGTTTDFVFPRSWTKQDNDIKYGHKVPYGDDSIADLSNNTHAMYHDFDDSHKEAAYHDFAEKGHDAYDKADTVDRMRHADEDFSGLQKFNDGDLPDDLDTLNDMSNSNKAEDIDHAFDHYKGGIYNEHLKAGTYRTDFKFYPRASVRGNGDIKLNRGADDPLASNIWHKDIGASMINDLDGQDVDRMFTPYWLPLGYYNTVFEKAETSNGGNDGDPIGIRLAGNYFNFENDRSDKAVAHMMLADQSKSEGLNSKGHGSDELAIQPVLSGHKKFGKLEYAQKPFGFTQFDMNWLTNGDSNQAK